MAGKTSEKSTKVAENAAARRGAATAAMRYLDIHDDDQLDETQFAAWVKQASQSPGERM